MIAAAMYHLKLKLNLLLYFFHDFKVFQQTLYLPSTKFHSFFLQKGGDTVLSVSNIIFCLFHHRWRYMTSMPGRPSVWTRKWWRECVREAENEAALWKNTDTWPLPSHPERLSDWAIVSTSPSICTPAPSASPQHIVPPPCSSPCSLTSHTH